MSILRTHGELDHEEQARLEAEAPPERPGWREDEEAVMSDVITLQSLEVLAGCHRHACGGIQMLPGPFSVILTHGDEEFEGSILLNKDDAAQLMTEWASRLHP